MPQEQLPPLEQVSAEIGSHALHAEPATPHSKSERDLQVVPSQQPSGQESAPQPQMPPTHCCPAAHWGPLPHRHPPVALQPSEAMVLQAAQAAPFGPQVASVRGLQVEPVQQPEVQEAAQPLQAPLVQVSVPGQPWHAVPAAPQIDAVFPGKQAPPEQHPAQESASQTHIPLLQRCPGRQAAVPPH